MKLSNSIKIKSDPAAVFDWVKDRSRAKQWIKSVKEIEVIREVEGVVGTTYRQVNEEEGRLVEMKGVVKEYVPGQKIIFYLERELATIDVEFTLFEREGFTELVENVTIHFQGKLKIPALFGGAKIRKALNAQIQSELAMLKELCEKG